MEQPPGSEMVASPPGEAEPEGSAAEEVVVELVD